LRASGARAVAREGEPGVVRDRGKKPRPPTEFPGSGKKRGAGGNKQSSNLGTPVLKKKRSGLGKKGGLKYKGGGKGAGGKAGLGKHDRDLRSGNGPKCE